MAKYVFTVGARACCCLLRSSLSRLSLDSSRTYAPGTLLSTHPLFRLRVRAFASTRTSRCPHREPQLSCCRVHFKHDPSRKSKCFLSGHSQQHTLHHLICPRLRREPPPASHCNASQRYHLFPSVLRWTLRQLSIVTLHGCLASRMGSRLPQINTQYTPCGRKCTISITSGLLKDDLTVADEVHTVESERATSTVPTTSPSALGLALAPERSFRASL